MAFMALFGWVFFLMIPAFFIGRALELALTWAAAHLFLANVAITLLLALNLLILRALLKIRAKWKREGKLKREMKGVWGRFCLFMGLFLEFSAVLICLTLLVLQPIPYLASQLL